MAFLQASGNTPYFFIDRYVGSQKHLKEWVYITVDSLSVIASASYFSTYTGPAPVPGDIIRVYQVTDRNDLSTRTISGLLLVNNWATSSFTILWTGTTNQTGYRDVSEFGAVGDGTTDDGVAINRGTTWLRSVIDAGYSAELHFSSPKYLTTIPLDFTNIRPSGTARWFITGSTVITGECAGKDIIDCKRSRRATFRGIFANGSSTSIPRNGFRLGRGKFKNSNTSGSGEVADSFVFYDCGSLGHFLWAGLYNFSSESFIDMGGCWINERVSSVPAEGVLTTASQTINTAYAMILDSGNIWDSDASDYYTASNPIGVAKEMSFNEPRFFGTQWRRPNGGPSWWLTTGVSSVKVYSGYFATIDGDAMICYIPRTQSGSLRAKATAWFFDLHMEHDDPDTEIAFTNGFRIIPLDNNSGSAINVKFTDFTWKEENFHGDDALFRMSSLFPTGSDVMWRDCDIRISKFHGNDSVDSGGAPTYGTFAPSTGSTMTVVGHVMLPTANNVGTFPTSGVTVKGNLTVASATNSDTQYPLGSFDIAHPGTYSYHKGRHVFFGGDASTYSGTDIPPTHELASESGQLIFSRGPILEHGTSTPESAVTAATDSIFLQTDATGGNAIWHKKTGSGNTGWLNTYAGSLSEQLATWAAKRYAVPSDGSDATSTLITMAAALSQNQSAKMPPGTYLVSSSVTGQTSTNVTWETEHGVSIDLTSATNWFKDRVKPPDLSVVPYFSKIVAGGGSAGVSGGHELHTYRLNASSAASSYEFDTWRIGVISDDPSSGTGNGGGGTAVNLDAVALRLDAYSTTGNTTGRLFPLVLRAKVATESRACLITGDLENSGSAVIAPGADFAKFGIKMSTNTGVGTIAYRFANGGGGGLGWHYGLQAEQDGLYNVATARFLQLHDGSANNVFGVDRDGSVLVGAATGGMLGAGKVNVSSNYYVNNVALPQVGVANTWTAVQTFNANIELGHSSVTCANGLNSNLTGPGKSNANISGPTGAFSIGGFTGGTDGRLLIIYNSVAFAMTIVNNDGSSTAGNRINTLTGADVTLRAGVSACGLVYNTTLNRWVLLWTN